MTEPEFLTVEDVAKRLKVSVETVRRWLRAKELPAFRFGRRGDYRIDPRDLDAFIESGKMIGGTGKELSLCYLCQKRPGTTKDHIPPQALITNKQAGQLITAPCCENCRTQNQRDDEYFRNVVVLPADPKATGPVYQAMLRSFQRRPALKATMLSRTRRIGNRLLFVARGDTMTRVLVRIARGLALRKAGNLIPVDCKAEVIWNPSDIGGDLIAQAQFHGVIGEDFSYAGLVAADDPALSFWWMDFYKSSEAIVIFDSPEADLAQDEDPSDTFQAQR